MHGRYANSATTTFGFMFFYSVRTFGDAIDTSQHLLEGFFPRLIAT